MAAFNIPLNLPHAATIARRIDHHIREKITVMTDGHRALLSDVSALQDALAPAQVLGDNPPGDESKRLSSAAAMFGRKIVDQIEALHIGHDKLGQAVRNLFECVERGEEGAALSLRAGENPDSLMRPT